MFRLTIRFIKTEKFITIYCIYEIKTFWHAISYLKPYKLDITMSTDSKGRVNKIKIDKETFVRFSIKPNDKNVADMDFILTYLQKNYSN